MILMTIRLRIWECRLCNNFQMVNLFLIRYMFRSFDHLQAGGHK
jgi:hypothetical protein